MRSRGIDSAQQREGAVPRLPRKFEARRKTLVRLLLLRCVPGGRHISIEQRGVKPLQRQSVGGVNGCLIGIHRVEL